MTKAQEDKRLEFAEVDALARNHLPGYRLYYWRDVESMREDLAATAMSASGHRAHRLMMRFEILSQFEELDAIIEVLRAEKRYDLSDRLRRIKVILAKAEKRGGA